MLEWFVGRLDLLQVSLVRAELFRKSLAHIQGFWKAEGDACKDEKCRIGVLVQESIWSSQKNSFWRVDVVLISWEFWWIGGEPTEQQFVVGKIIDHGLPMTHHRSLGHL